MIIDISTMPEELLNAWFSFHVNNKMKYAKDIKSLEARPGIYYLCTDSGQLMTEQPSCKHEQFLLGRQNLLEYVPSQVWQEFLSYSRLDSIQEEVLCIQTDLWLRAQD